ncbi:MAG: KUP/HAK/KT family potassium transporter [Candidatus Eremiobacteraeota bacterium]|nr:KUP/HAK/KT family potassium transporter [Candidatus Eremiobacteraeota bacterium]
MSSQAVPAPPIAKAPARHRPSRHHIVALAALGVVFGDIGTSPLYAFKLCFTGEFPAALTPANILGILSLIFWALIVVVCIKYVTFMLRADFDGQGGTIALLALLSPERKSALPVALGTLAIFVLFGESMLYGDGVITPAISVLSAVEGLDVWTKAAHPFIIPLSVLVLIGLFAMQSRGTDKIGKLFGPIMLLWFASIAIFGALGIAHHPNVVRALNPAYAVEFFLHNGWRAVLVFGAVVLCITGVEALYADLAHFGRIPITFAWYGIVFPALLLNYFGQGAYALTNPRAFGSPFFSLVPPVLLIPMVLLATVATVIASQALISGVFSLTNQLMQLGYSPRFRIIHTSRHFAGQIYMPAVNALLAIVCIALVLAFRSSDAFGGAYGLAVTVTMIVSSITFYQLLVRRWNWPLWQAVPLVALFLMWDIPFLAGNIPKILSGGWVPLVIAGVLFTLFVTWNRGRRRMMEGLAEHSMPVENFLEENREATQVGGTAVFMAPEPKGIPFIRQHHWLRNHVSHETVVLLTILSAARPYVHATKRLTIEDEAPRVWRVRASYGFMQSPGIKDILVHLKRERPEIDLSKVTYYLASPKFSNRTGPRALPVWQRALFRWMTRNARPLTDSLGLPPNNIVEFGVEVDL